MNNEEIQSNANRIERQLTSPTVSLILVTSIIGAAAYLIFLLTPSIRGNRLPYIMALIAEIFLILQGMLSFWTILSRRYNPRNFEYHKTQDNLFNPNIGKTAIKILKRRDVEIARSVDMYVNQSTVSVDVFITVYGEPIEDVRATITAARDIYGKHESYVLDDGKSDDVKNLTEELNVHYIRRDVNTNAKAGNINNALSQTNGDFFLILDADFVAFPTILYETLPFFENDKLAFVQTPQYYNNQINFVSTAANFMQHVFYSLIQSGKNRFNSAFCVGTNVVFRRSAVMAVGGLYEKSKSEDIWTSIMLHEKGFDSIYIPNVLAIGKTPETLKAYSKQQLRWATGSFEIFLHHNPIFSRKMTMDQRLQYFATTSYYFVGFSMFLLILLPILQIFFNLSPIATTVPVWEWAILYSGFYLTQLLLSFYTMGGLKLKTIMLASVSFPIYIKAFFNALFYKDQSWQATHKLSFDSPFNYIRVQTYIFVFLLLTTAVGIWKVFYTDEFSIALIWNMINTLIFGYFFIAALNESHSLSIQRTVIVKNQITEEIEGSV